MEKAIQAMETHRITDEPIPDPVEDPPTAGAEEDPAGDDLSPPELNGIRSITTPPPRSFTEEEELANCLVMLSSSRADLEKPSTSGRKEVNDDIAPPPAPISRELFVCKGCKKVFISHQALGGHRASHKKVKGCYAAPPEIESPDADNRIVPSPENTPLSIAPLAEKSPRRSAKNKSKIHECSVCNRLFPSGQALGGHKRCHWMASQTNMAGAGAGEAMAVGNQSDHSLDLNRAAPEEDEIAGIPMLLDVPGVIYMQSGWSAESRAKEEEKGGTTGGNLDDEAESREVKADELSHLKDMDEGGESSEWLKIGMGSTTN